MTLLTHHPLFAIALTLAAFLIAAWLYRRSGWLLLQPVLVSVTLIVATLLLCGVDYATYRAGAEPVAWLLGPATVALAVPLQHNIKRIRQLFWPVLITLTAGGVLSVALTLAIGWALGADWSVVMSLAPKIRDHADCHAGGRADRRRRLAGGGDGDAHRGDRYGHGAAAAALGGRRSPRGPWPELRYQCPCHRHRARLAGR